MPLFELFSIGGRHASGDISSTSSSGNSRIHWRNHITSNAMVAWRETETSGTFGRSSDDFRRVFRHCRKWNAYNAKISRHLQIFVLHGVGRYVYSTVYMYVDVTQDLTCIKSNVEISKIILSLPFNYLWNVYLTVKFSRKLYISCLSHRPSRNLSEKKRRDKLNIYISELAAMVPACANSQRKLDKTTVLKMTVAYMKMHNGEINIK